MRGNTARQRLLKTAFSSTALILMTAFGWFLIGHATAPVRQGLPTDWSHRHLIFSQPTTPEQAARLKQDPRYWQQWYRQNATRVLAPDSVEPIAVHLGDTWSRNRVGDWSVNLGSGGTAGAGNFPAKYSFRTTTASCTNDYVVFATGLAGASNQASIVAYNNLYSGCGGTVPQVYWAYNTNAGVIMTSPVISGDGTQIAFAQTTSGSSGLGSLAVLKFLPSATDTVISPTTLLPVASTAYRNCTAPCMVEIPLVTSHGVQLDDRTSSAFPDYTHDILWVGSTVSWLHQIAGVFRGNPAEVTTGGFPVQLNPGDPTTLSSPVYDYTSNTVFVGDYGGYVYSLNPNLVNVTQSAQIDHGAGIVAGPIVDGMAEQLYVFASNDGTTLCAGTGPCSAVFQFSITAGLALSTKAVVGTSAAAPAPLFDGAFDSAYEASSNASGNLYVCGNTGGPPILYQVPISGGVMQAVVAGPVISNATAACSPVTDLANPNATGFANSEWLFASTTAGGLGSNCATGACLMNFGDAPWQHGTTYVAGQQVLDSNLEIQNVLTGGTSGATHPTWSTTVGGNTTDGGVHWLNQGTLAASYTAWQALHLYTVNTTIIDSNGYIELASSVAGLSGATHPTWTTTLNANTTDALVTWKNLGPAATASYASAGGTSGIILDNVVGSGTLAGASQIYFTTQGNQTCATGGTGGCAIQASQSALQ